VIKTNNSNNIAYSVILAVLSNGFKFTPLLTSRKRDLFDEEA